MLVAVELCEVVAVVMVEVFEELVVNMVVMGSGGGAMIICPIHAYYADDCTNQQLSTEDPPRRKYRTQG